MKTLFAIWKPKGPTSHDMIYKIRKITGEKKVGHAGTLDPLAEGVLVIGMTRQGTKQLTAEIKRDKEYIATVKLGLTSTTDDEEGEKTLVSNDRPAADEIKEVLKEFVGNIQQVPPQFSAIKVKGKKAYEEARKGRAIKLEPREVEINEIELLEYAYPMIQLRVATGSGVYIRSLARDVGEKLQTGAYLANLIRTRVGEFTKEDAITLEELEKEYA